jgi:hypothetical protein
MCVRVRACTFLDKAATFCYSVQESGHPPNTRMPEDSARCHTAVGITCRGTNRAEEIRPRDSGRPLLPSRNPDFTLYIRVRVSALRYWSRGSSFSVVTDLRACQPRDSGLMSDRVKYFSLPQIIQTGCRYKPVYHPVGSGFFPLAVKRDGAWRWPFP